MRQVEWNNVTEQHRRDVELERDMKAVAAELDKRLQYKTEPRRWASGEELVNALGWDWQTSTTLARARKALDALLSHGYVRESKGERRFYKRAGAAAAMYQLAVSLDEVQLKLPA